MWHGCCLAPVPVTWFVACCARCPGLRNPVAVVAWYLSVCLGCDPQRASLACLAAPRWCAAPRPVRSLSVLRSASPVLLCLFSSPWAFTPRLSGRLRGARGGRPRTGLLVPSAGPCRGRAMGSLRVIPVQGPTMGLCLANPSSVGLGLRALWWFAYVDPVTDASGSPYRPSSDGGLGRCTVAFSCGRPHRPFWVRGRHTRVPCVCACACPSWPGRAGLPPGRVLMRLTFSCGLSWCALYLLSPLP